MASGQRVALAPRKTKVDLVVVAARYREEGAERKLDFAQAYERHGVVWSDIKLYDRAKLMAAFEGGKRVHAGRPGELSTDFILLHALKLEGEGAQARIVSDTGGQAAGDDLGVPLV